MVTRRHLGALFLLVWAPACGALIGIKSLTPDEDETGDGGPSADGPASDATVDGNGLEGGEGGCGDVTQNADHCGRCGHTCLGGTCSGSQCQPKLLAGAQGTVAGVAIDDKYVYFTSLSNAVVARVSKNGGTVATIAGAPNVRLAKRLAVDGTHVYWANAEALNASIARCPIAGCVGSPEVVSSQPEEPVGIALDPSYVTWADRNGSKIGRKPLDGGPEETVATTQGALPFAVVVGGGSTFWIKDFSGQVERSNPADGGVFAIGVNGQSGRDLALDPTFVYWGAAVNPGDPGRISRAPRDGTGPTQLLGPAHGEPMALAVDDARVYWTSSRTLGDGGISGGVYSCDRAGCGTVVTTLASDQDLPRGIAVDATAIYWGANGGVWKVAKP